MKSRRKAAIVQTTVASKAQARKLAALIIGRKLGACAQFMPIRSLYRWRGKLESAKEFLIIVKTRQAFSARLAAFIRANHPYELPEIMIMPNSIADPRYLEWVYRETE